MWNGQKTPVWKLLSSMGVIGDEAGIGDLGLYTLEKGPLKDISIYVWGSHC